MYVDDDLIFVKTLNTLATVASPIFRFLVDSLQVSTASYSVQIVTYACVCHAAMLRHYFVLYNIISSPLIWRPRANAHKAIICYSMHFFLFLTYKYIMFNVILFMIPSCALAGGSQTSGLCIMCNH